MSLESISIFLLELAGMIFMLLGFRDLFLGSPDITNFFRGLVLLSLGSIWCSIREVNRRST